MNAQTGISASSSVSLANLLSAPQPAVEAGPAKAQPQADRGGRQNSSSSPAPAQPQQNAAPAEDRPPSACPADKTAKPVKAAPKAQSAKQQANFSELMAQFLLAAGAGAVQPVQPEAAVTSAAGATQAVQAVGAVAPAAAAGPVQAVQAASAKLATGQAPVQGVQVQVPAGPQAVEVAEPAVPTEAQAQTAAVAVVAAPAPAKPQVQAAPEKPTPAPQLPAAPPPAAATPAAPLQAQVAAGAIQAAAQQTQPVAPQAQPVPVAQAAPQRVQTNQTVQAVQPVPQYGPVSPDVRAAMAAIAAEVQQAAPAAKPALDPAAPAEQTAAQGVVQALQAGPSQGDLGVARAAETEWAVTEAVAPSRASAGEQITTSLVSANLRSGQELVVRLDPPSLGEVRIRVSNEGGQLIARLEVSRASTLAQLEQEAPALIQRLADQGVQMRKLDLSLNDSAMQQGFAQAQQQQQQAPWQERYDLPAEALRPAWADSGEPSAGQAARAGAGVAADESLNFWV